MIPQPPVIENGTDPVSFPPVGHEANLPRCPPGKVGVLARGPVNGRGTAYFGARGIATPIRQSQVTFHRI